MEDRQRKQWGLWRLLLLAAGVLLVFWPASGRSDVDPAISAADPGSTESVETLPLPPTVELAFQEITRNNEYVDRLQELLKQKLTAFADEKERFATYRKTLENSWRALLAMAGKCVQEKAAELARKKLADDSRQALRGLNRLVKGDPMIYASRLEDDLKELCNPQPRLGLLREEDIRDALEQIDAMRARWVQAAQQEIDDARRLKEGRAKLRGRLEAQLSQLKSAQDKTVTFVADLKWLVMILGLLSVCVILIIRTFPEEVQTEWVASGQVIQFMTVLIILIAILALGITGVLKENTLGTLLGGIGGYVLSQGIGRAAARYAAKQVTSSRAAAGPRAPWPEAPPSTGDSSAE